MLERFIEVREGGRIVLSLGKFRGIERLDIRFQFNAGKGWLSTMRGVVVPRSLAQHPMHRMSTIPADTPLLGRCFDDSQSWHVTHAPRGCRRSALDRPQAPEAPETSPMFCPSQSRFGTPDGPTQCRR